MTLLPANVADFLPLSTSLFTLSPIFSAHDLITFLAPEIKSVVHFLILSPAEVANFLPFSTSLLTLEPIPDAHLDNVFLVLEIKFVVHLPIFDPAFPISFLPLLMCFPISLPTDLAQSVAFPGSFLAHLVIFWPVLVSFKNHSATVPIGLMIKPITSCQCFCNQSAASPNHFVIDFQTSLQKSRNFLLCLYNATKPATKAAIAVTTNTIGLASMTRFTAA